MSASFVSASSQRLLNTASPVTAYPFTIGLWVKPTTLAVAKVIVSVGDPADTNHINLYQRTGNIFQIFTTGAGSSTGGGTVSNQWFFFVLRAISATNRRWDYIAQDGSTATDSTNVSGPLGAMTSIALGATASTVGASFFDGNIAEFWVANTDIQLDGLVLQQAMLQQLAYGGPFSVPHIAKDIADYRSLRSALDSNQDNLSDYESGNKGRQTWVNTNGVTLGAHPPLPGWYRGPNDVNRIGLI